MADGTEKQPDAGDRTEEFVRLFTAHQRQIYAFIRLQLPNAADADDVWQSTNLLLWKKFGQFQPGTNFRNWAFQVARFEVLNHRTSRAATTLNFSDQLLESLVQDSIEQGDRDSQRLEAFQYCLNRLTSRERHVVELRFSEGESGESVARQLGRSPQYVYKLVSKVRSRLIECVRRRLRLVEVLP